MQGYLSPEALAAEEERRKREAAEALKKALAEALAKGGGTAAAAAEEVVTLTKEVDRLTKLIEAQNTKFGQRTKQMQESLEDLQTRNIALAEQVCVRACVRACVRTCV
jgi:hypothetical protein